MFAFYAFDLVNIVFVRRIHACPFAMKFNSANTV